MERKPNLNNNKKGKIGSGEHGLLPSLDYRFFEYMQEGVIVYAPVCDESGKIVDLIIKFANLAAYRQRKSLKKGLIGNSIIELYGHEAAAFDLKKANEVVSTGKGTKYEIYYVFMDKCFLVTAFSPKKNMYITLTTDITRRKKAEEEIRIEREKLLDIIEFLPDPTFVIDEDKKVIAWNKAMEEMTSTPKEEMLGKGDYAYSIPLYGERRPILIDLIFLEDEEIEAKYDYVSREGDILSAELFMDRLSGGKGAYVFKKASPLYDKEGSLVGSIETIHDISRQKRIEIELHESEEKFRSSIEQSSDGIVIIDENGTIIEWNKAMEKITGYKREYEIGKLVWDSQYELLPEKQKTSRLYDYIKGTILDFLETGHAEWINKTLDRKIQRQDGEIRTIQSVTYPIKTEKGRIVGSITRDITWQKKAEERLQDTLKNLEIEKNQLSAIIENTPVGVIIAEAPSGKFLLANKQISKIWRYPKTARADEFKKYKGFHPDGRPYKPGEWPLSRSIRTGEVVKDEEIEILRGDGTKGWLSVNSVPVRDNKGNIILGIVIDLDITERKKAEERTRRALEEIVEAYFELDNEWSFVEANEKASKILGKKRTELIGNIIWDVIPELKDGEIYKQYHKAKKENVPVHFEIKSIVSEEWYEMHAYPGDEGLTVYAHNINELKKAICPKED
ncbi:MAG: PAS domain S-box protein [Methanobacterium sp.]|jgi:PAS domain S-box-containing protein